MRLRYLSAFVLIVLLLAGSVGAAQAANGPAPHGAPLPGNPTTSEPPQVAFGAAAEPVSVQEMLARVSGVSGTIYSYAGTPVVGAEVYAGYVSAGGTWHYSPMATTDGAGAYTIANLAPSTNGFVETWYKEGGEWRGIWESPLTFVDAVTSTVDVGPGRVGWQAERSDDSYWNGWGSPEVWLENADDSGAQTYYSFDTYGTESGSAESAPGNVSWAAMNFWWNEADEWVASGPVTVTAGADAGQQISFNESESLRSWLTSPYWGSCRPGTTVKFKLQNWTAGYGAAFRGWGDSPGARETSFGGKMWTSPGTNPPAVKLRIPPTAKPGYGYIVSARRTDNPAGSLYLRNYLQLCSFKSTKTSVSRGTTVRLSGVVPTQGHWGKTAGKRKYVTIYAAKYGKAVPTQWNPVGHGWYKLGTVRTNGYGAFRTPLVKILGSGTLIARYEGDSWYWGAFTSKVNIRVR